jgi:protein-tyrosine kinase
MTILEALEKAKRMHAQRAREPSAEDRADTSPTRRRKLEIAPASIVALNYPRLDIDRTVCERNRVLFSAPQGSAHARAIDSFRILRTRLRNRIGTEQFVSLGVISAGPNEGKSVIAINLALAFANEKRRNVFLLDLDLRNPSICRYLGAAPAVELGSCLAHAAKPEDAFFNIGVDNLAVAGGVMSDENSSELLGGAGLASFFDYIRQTDPNALIIADLPPLLQSADSLVVAPHLATMLLVIGEGVTRRDHLSRATELLAGLTVAGVVLNRSREAVEDYYG